MKTAVIGILFSVFGGAAGQLFMKSGMTRLGDFFVFEIPGMLLNSPALFSEILIGILFYCCSVFSWLIALRHFDLNLAYPILALGYALVYVGAAYWPGIEEPFTTHKTLAVMLIILGVALTTVKSKAGPGHE